MDKPKPPVRGKYSIRNPVANFLFRCMDAFLSLCVPSSQSMLPIQIPQRILISNIAHLGDVIMATSILPILKQAYPEARISFLVGSWSLPILNNHPLVDEVHQLDHWAHNRAPLSVWHKFRHYLRTRREALRQIKAARYDIAIDLYWNFPNTLPLLWQAKIPTRVGYGSGGFGPLTTHCLDFDNNRLHASQRFLNLVTAITLAETDLPKLVPILPPLNLEDNGVAAFAAELSAAGLEGGDYLVFHVGAADSFRDWPTERWRELAKKFIDEGYTLFFTGTGSKDEARIQEITAGLHGCINLCSRQLWSGYVSAITNAKLLICVDTAAGHIAAAVGTPCVVITAGRWPYLWHPLGQYSRSLMAPVPCAPCHRNTGCKGMECIRDVSVASVYQGCQTLCQHL